MTTIDDPFWRREISYPVRIAGIVLGVAGITGAGIYMALDATVRSQDPIRRFIQTLAENQKADPENKPHLLIAYDRWDRTPGPKTAIAPLAREIPQEDLDAVIQQLKGKTDQDRQRQLHQRYESMNLANRVAQECQNAGIKYNLMGTKPSPSVHELIIMPLSEPPFMFTHMIYTQHAVDRTVAESAEKEYERINRLKPESLRVTNKTLEEIK